ncbi:MAG: hypothetical protein E7Z75_02585 [Methanobrevibacter olleyae]|uniref:Uncharacterized protein n=1 Tax=Methanobrevibacter olleyae TaxID=294671 RepID=A0A8T3VVN6_METOL|nr:hypothetical protein [Methanobrevibacter olleyae]
MKIDSRILAVLSALLVVAIAISSVGAVDNTSNGIDSANFAIDIPSGADFAEEATTNFNVGDLAMNMEVFANHGDNSNDVSTIVYLKDGSKDQSFISDVINDLKKDATILEENDKYFVLETKDANNWDFFNFDIGSDFDSIWNFASGIFSDDSDVNVTTEDADVEVSKDEGIHIVGDDNSTVSLSTKGLIVSDPNGDDVSISTDGVKVNDSNGENSVDANASFDGDIISNVDNADYSIIIESPENNQVIVLAGNDLELLKSLAETASFTN